MSRAGELAYLLKIAYIAYHEYARKMEAKTHMSLDVERFDTEIVRLSVNLMITDEHPLVRLGRHLPWQTMLEKVLPDFKVY